MWDVPADLEAATLRIAFGAANDGLDFFEVYFRDAVIEIELDFTGS